MVKTPQKFQYLTNGLLNIPDWLENMQKNHQINIELMDKAARFLQKFTQGLTTFYGKAYLELGLEISETILELKLDQEAAVAGMISGALPVLSENQLQIIHQELGATVSKLMTEIKKIDVISPQQYLAQNKLQIDKLRNMLLSMANDIRVVIIKLAERLCFMQGIKHIPLTERQRFSQEILDIYAPLANRLGIGQMKWQLEDLAFRYLEPHTYKSIAALLVERRVDREKHIKDTITKLQEKLFAVNIEAEITGRAKHIYSIYLKMQRKNKNYSNIYDHAAVRILVNNLQDCYTALSIVHQLWQPIIDEFDDYIAHPKPNGYRSIHTAVIGEDGQHFEIQIRTFDMHEEAERGVASHWVYKENKKRPLDHIARVAYLRQLLDWQKEILHVEKTMNTMTSLVEHAIYVFTPAADIIDLPKGATPLDFAYHVHSELGHRCRGAKVNGQIVSLSYVLQTGDKVEIIAAPQGHPSRDWLNPELKYLTTARAKSKVAHWFRQKTDNTKQTLERESTKSALAKTTVIAKTPKKINLKSLGSSIIGGEDLLTRFAKCCKPIPGDSIIGYITHGRGISIHKKNCRNICKTSKLQRVIDIAWNSKSTNAFITDLKITAEEQKNILNDLTALFANEKTALINFNSTIKAKNLQMIILATLQIQNIDQLQKLIDRIKQLPGIIEVQRI